MPRESISGRLAVITGGASGIGLALAEAYSVAGARLLLADRDAPALADAAARLRSAGSVVETVAIDLRDPQQVVEFADLASALGDLGALCLNAGVTTTGTTAWETTTETLDFMLDVNLRGLHNSIVAFVPRLITARRPADVIVTASMAGLVSSGHSGAYAASKAGAIALTRSLHTELRVTHPDIHVTLLAPGMVKTNLLRSSAAIQPTLGAMDAGLVVAAHDALNQYGLTPQAVAEHAIASVEAGVFWALPPPDDMFSQALKAETKDLLDQVA